MAQNPWSLPKGLTTAERKAVKAVFDALKAQKRVLSPEALNALKLGNIEQFLGFIQWEGLGDFGELQAILSGMAAKAGTEVFSPMGSMSAETAFNLVDPKAVAYAEREVGKLVREINSELLDTIRQTVAEATAGGLTVDQLARRITTNLPLTARDAKAVDNFRSRNFQNFLADGMDEAKARARAEEKAQRYADKMTRRRAKVIARTETANAAMNGRFIGWESAVGEGLIDNQSKKEWIAEPDACDICLPYDGFITSWDKDFPNGFKMPPAHPNCRCSSVILPPDTAETPYTEQAEAEYTPPPFRADEDEVITQYMEGGFKESSVSEIQQIPVITEEDTEAIGVYQQTDYNNINRWMRQDRFDGPFRNLGIEDSDYIKENALRLERLANQAKFTQPVVLSRGQDTFDLDVQIGDVYEAKGFTSTSAFTGFAGESVSTTFTKMPYQFRIYVPQGARGGALPYNPELAYASDEAEVLLPPNSRFTIVNIDTEGSKTLIEMILTEQK
jgi:hypothetical protein